MTENEAKQWLKHTRAYQHKCDNCEYIDIKGACNEECKDFYDMAIQALEEIQQYRAIGTIEDFKSFKTELSERHCSEHDKEIRNKAIDDFAERLKAERKETITTSSAFVARSFDEVVEEIAERLKGEKQ